MVERKGLMAIATLTFWMAIATATGAEDGNSAPTQLPSVPVFKNEFLTFIAFVLLGAPLALRPLIDLLHNRREFSRQMLDQRLAATTTDLEKYKLTIQKQAQENDLMENRLRALQQEIYLKRFVEGEANGMIDQALVYLNLLSLEDLTPKQKSFCDAVAKLLDQAKEKNKQTSPTTFRMDKGDTGFDP